MMKKDSKFMTETEVMEMKKLVERLEKENKKHSLLLALKIPSNLITIYELLKDWIL